MKLIHKNKTIDELFFHKNISYVIIGALGLSNLILVIFLLNREERWVLIPQYNTTHRVLVTSDGYSDEYIIDWAESSLRNLLTVNPNTVERQNRLFAEFSNDTQDVNVFLKDHKNFIQENDASSVFYPKTFEVLKDQSKVLIHGDLNYRFGLKKELIQSQKSFEITYHMGPQGILLVQSVKEVPCA